MREFQTLLKIGKKITFVWNGSAGESVEVTKILFRPDLDADSGDLTR